MAEQRARKGAASSRHRIAPRRGTFHFATPGNRHRGDEIRGRREESNRGRAGKNEFLGRMNLAISGVAIRALEL